MAGTRKFDEETVLQQAVEIFWEKGYTATTMLDLAKRTGVQRGSLYNAYQTKNNLFLKAFAHYTRTLLQTIEADLQQETLTTSLHHMFSQLVQRLSQNNDYRGCFSTRTMMEASQQCPKIDNSLKGFLDGLENLITLRLQQAIKEQEFTGDAPATARYLTALTRAIAVIERVYGNKERMTEIYQTALTQMHLTQQ